MSFVSVYISAIPEATILADTLYLFCIRLKNLCVRFFFIGLVVAFNGLDGIFHKIFSSRRLNVDQSVLPHLVKFAPVISTHIRKVKSSVASNMYLPPDLIMLILSRTVTTGWWWCGW